MVKRGSRCVLCRWNELVGYWLDEGGQYRLRALEQVCPDRARFATCLADGRRGLVEVYRVSESEARERLAMWEETAGAAASASGAD